MKLDRPFLQLPLLFDASVIEREIESLGESVWRPHPQGFAGNSALPLVSVDGNPASDAVHGPMRPTPHLLACPYLMQVMASLGAVWGRSRLMRLAGQAEVTPHVDINYYWREHMRVHVPIVTQPTVRFHCDDAVINMKAGECWTFDTWRLHRVHNDDSRSRIHLVADTVGGPGFWELMRDARPHDVDAPQWRPRYVAPGNGPATLEFESVNLPKVMTPWEVREHVAFLVREAPPSDALDRFMSEAMQPFTRNWHALWARFGDSGRGYDEYRALREQMRAQVASFETIRLRNGVLLVKALHAIVTGNLVANPEPAAMRPPMAAARSGAAPPARPSLPQAAISVPSPRAPDSPVQPAARTHVAFNFGPRPVASPARPLPLRFDRPVILLSAPRSGSTLLFETLSKAPGVFTIGRESHRIIESLPGLHPSARDFESNRLAASDATPAVIAAVQRNFAEMLRDRDGRIPSPHQQVRLLEKTPKNALRLPFLRRVFPDARFVYLYREPREVLASMIEAWQSGKFGTYPNLPDWTGLPWSLLLVPGWRDLVGRPLEEIVAHQWRQTTDALMDDLADLPASQWVHVRYDALVARPGMEIRRLCEYLELGWDSDLDELPLSRHTLSPPDPDKWRRYGDAITRVLPTVESARCRAERALIR